MRYEYEIEEYTESSSLTNERGEVVAVIDTDELCILDEDGEQIDTATCITCDMREPYDYALQEIGFKYADDNRDTLERLQPGDEYLIAPFYCVYMAIEDEDYDEKYLVIAPCNAPTDPVKRIRLDGFDVDWRPVLEKDGWEVSDTHRYTGNPLIITPRTPFILAKRN